MACSLIILDLWARECATEDGGGGACASFWENAIDDSVRETP